VGHPPPPSLCPKGRGVPSSLGFVCTVSCRNVNLVGLLEVETEGSRGLLCPGATQQLNQSFENLRGAKTLRSGNQLVTWKPELSCGWVMLVHRL